MAQALGIERISDKLIVIPKYIISDKNSPWRLGTLYLSRIISEYGPLGILKATSKAFNLVKKCYSSLYLTNVPCIGLERVVRFSEPRKAVLSIIKKPKSTLDYDLINVLTALRSEGIDLNNVGITGSLALGFANPSISDIDLVIYGEKNSKKIIRLFEKFMQKEPSFKDLFGGVKVMPPINVSWRRSRIKNRFVSWIGVPERILSHCKAVVKSPPYKRCKVVLEIENGQPNSLLYPPCVISKGGETLVSFEYNLAYMLFKGGKFKIEALCSEDESTVYLGTREFPGVIVREQ